MFRLTTVHGWVFRRLVVVAASMAAAAVFALSPAPARADTWIIQLDEAARQEPATGRIILFFSTPTMHHWKTYTPTGPSYNSPQPVASAAIENLKPGESITIDGSTFAFTGKGAGTLNDLHGSMRVVAAIDADQTERSWERGPGNVRTEPMIIELDREADDVIELSLIKPELSSTDFAQSRIPSVKWIKIRSDMLSAFYGRDIHHLAGVALPRGYADEAHADRSWPAVYVIPGFGGGFGDAERYARMFDAGFGDVLPPAVHIVLDPDAPLGHHGFADSANNGPRGRALVQEFIPYLEREFRLAPRPEARIVTGHSSGGWSSLWLQLQYPDVFGACFSSAPDPIDFRAFQMTNIYEDDNLYVHPSGSEQPSMRNNQGNVLMLARTENLVEYAIDPHGGSGEQWDAWESMFSPREPDTGYPIPLFDPVTGVINRTVAEAWRKYDITHLVKSDWAKFGPIVTQRVRLACGDNDSFYLNRAVELFKTQVEKLNGGSLDDDGDDAPGYILLVKGADHGSVSRTTHHRWNHEMREHLAAHDLLFVDAKTQAGDGDVAPMEAPASDE